MSPRNLRNTMQRRCDQIKNCIDNVLHHVYELHKVYYTGEEFPEMAEWFDLENGEYLQPPKYPDHIEQLDGYIAYLQQAIKFIESFKSDMV